MYDDILIPTDGSAVAERAFEAVLQLTNQRESTIHLLHVLDLGDIPSGIREEVEGELTNRGEGVLEELAEAVSDEGFDVETTLESTIGSIHEQIVKYADSHGIDFIAMGTKRESALERFLVGSVTQQTLRDAPAPVLTVNPDYQVGGSIDTILHPNDGSEGAMAAAEHALTVSEELEATLHVVNVVDITGPWGTLDREYIMSAFEEAGQAAVDSVIERSKQRDISSIQASVINGVPADAILEYSSEQDIDLVVMGTHGRSGLRRALLGSVAEKVIGRSTVPVLTTNPDE